MKALITGGAGFIGSYLAEELLRRGDEVSIIDNLSTGSLENISHLQENDKFSYVIDSIMNKKIMRRLIGKCNIVYHLASAVGVKLVMDRPLSSLQTNIQGTEILLELASKEKKKVIITSSSEIYGKNGNIPFKEDDDRILGSIKIQRWGYSCSKAAAEFLSLAYFREKDLPVVITRLFNTCGSRQTGNYGMVVPRFVKRALSNQPLIVYSDGEQTRSFTYVTDVVDGIITLAHHPKAVGEIFNIGSEGRISIKDLAKKIISLTKSKSEVKYIPYKEVYKEGFEDMRHRLPDITKIKKLTGYSPKVGLDEMIKKISQHI